jgi:thiol-disulfide isomerase/thioredoxin
MSKKPSPVLLIFLAFPLLGFLAAAIVMIGNAPGGINGTPPTPAPVTLAPLQAAPDSPMIDFTLTSLDGATVSLSDYAGRIVFLNFWATWCVPCQKELPAFQQFQSEQPPDGAAILAVNWLETPDLVTGFLTQYGATDLTVLMDSEGKVYDSYGVFNLPTTYVIDEQGMIRFTRYGGFTVADLYAYVDELNAA